MLCRSLLTTAVIGAGTKGITGRRTPVTPTTSFFSRCQKHIWTWGTPPPPQPAACLPSPANAPPPFVSWPPVGPLQKKALRCYSNIPQDNEKILNDTQTSLQNHSLDYQAINNAGVRMQTKGGPSQSPFLRKRGERGWSANSARAESSRPVLIFSSSGRRSCAKGTPRAARLACPCLWPLCWSPQRRNLEGGDPSRLLGRLQFLALISLHQPLGYQSRHRA